MPPRFRCCAGAVDIAVAALTIHHLTPDEATAALAAMAAGGARAWW